RHLPFASVAHGLHLALDAAVAEATGHDEPIETDERLDVAVALEALAVDPRDLHVAAGGPRRVLHRLRHGEVRIGELDVLAHAPDAQRDARAADVLGERLPFRKVGLRGAVAKTELLDDDPAQTRFFAHARPAIDP